MLPFCDHCQAIYIHMRTVVAHLLVQTVTGGSQSRAKQNSCKASRRNQWTLWKAVDRSFSFLIWPQIVWKANMMEVDTAKRTGTAFCRRRCCISILRRQQHPKRLWAFFKGLKTAHCNVVFPVPSPEPLRGCRRSARQGFCMSGQTSSWDRSHSCTLLSPALQLLLGDFGQAALCLSFPNCKTEKEILLFAQIFLLQEYLWIRYLSARQHH